MSLRVLHLYRPCLPSSRAQAIQVLGTCWGLADLGHEVTLLADPPRGEHPSPEQVLAWYDLPEREGLKLEIAPPGAPWVQSLWFRWRALRWLWPWGRGGRRSVILARAKRYFDEYTILPFGPPVVLEAHEVDSALSAERGEANAEVLRLERRLLKASAGLVTNCQGTLSLLEQVHGEVLPAARRVVWNATSARRVRDRWPGPERVLGYLGSLRSFKGLRTLLTAAERLPPGLTLELLGGSPAEIQALGPLPPGVRALGELPFREIPDHIARWHGAVVALDDNLFGRHLCNPLKLWDYLAIGLPIIAPDLPTLREVLRDHPSCWYQPGDPDSLREVMLSALRHPERQQPPRRWLRSWRTRAQELLEVLEPVAR